MSTVMWKAWGPAVLWAAVLFFLSEASSLPRGFDLPFLDKVAHFILYFILGAALGRGRRAVGPSAPHWALLAAGWAYGAVDEWHQSWVPGRSPDPWDFLVDVLGVTAGYLAFLVVAEQITRKKEDGLSP